MRTSMRLSKAFHKSLWIVVFVAPGLFLMGWRFHRLGRSGAVSFHTYDLQSEQSGQWQAIGGKWAIMNGVIYNSSYERGAKLLTGSDSWQNYTLTSDVKFTGTNADMGVVIRVNDARKGTDTYNGYYIGLRTLDGTMVVGRSDFGWREGRPVVIPGGVQPDTWYRLKVVAYGCNIGASVQNLATLQTAWIAFQESACTANGRIGLRSLNAGGMWRNISVAPATWDDYLEVRRHTASVEHPEILPGPPWWTPWHAGILFGSMLALLLFVQFVYFRMQEWKAWTIAQERERLAHDIHDTMAQSFAGIGYQIQGIYHNVLRGGPLDSSAIASQLNVAYQLVRRCHEEASRTIAMLGSPLPFTQKSLLEVLGDTAQKISGDKIKVVTELRGTSFALNLRVADALLHIGREAIVNAISHSSLTMLKIVLNYTRKSVDLIVEDNGCGFDFTPENTGFGILGMQKRSRDIGAVLHIFSSPGRGTKVWVTATIQHENLLKQNLAKIKSKLASFHSTPNCKMLDHPNCRLIQEHGSGRA